MTHLLDAADAITVHVGIYDICVSKEMQRGAFEGSYPAVDPWDGFEYEEVIGGGLWITGNELQDYDGSTHLPDDVQTGLRMLGIVVDHEIFNNDPVD
jgi:hypothetical protein